MSYVQTLTEVVEAEVLGRPGMMDGGAMLPPAPSGGASSAPARLASDVSVRATSSARRNALYSPGVCAGETATASYASATSFTSVIVFCSWSRNAWNSGRMSCRHGQEEKKGESHQRA